MMRAKQWSSWTGQWGWAGFFVLARAGSWWAYREVQRAWRGAGDGGMSDGDGDGDNGDDVGRWKGGKHSVFLCRRWFVSHLLNVGSNFRTREAVLDIAAKKFIFAETRLHDVI